MWNLSILFYFFRYKTCTILKFHGESRTIYERLWSEDLLLFATYFVHNNWDFQLCCHNFDICDVIQVFKRSDRKYRNDIPSNKSSFHGLKKRRFLHQIFGFPLGESYKSIFVKIFSCFFFNFSRLLQPICLGYLVSYFARTEGTNITQTEAYFYAMGIVLTSLLMLMIVHPFYLFAFKSACKVRVACSGLIYKKALRMLKSSAEEGQSGRIVTLLTNDLAKLEHGFKFLNDLFIGTFETIAFFIVIYLKIGVAAVIGMATLVLFIPLQSKFLPNFQINQNLGSISKWV